MTIEMLILIISGLICGVLGYIWGDMNGFNRGFDMCDRIDKEIIEEYRNESK